MSPTRNAVSMRNHRSSLQTGTPSHAFRLTSPANGRAVIYLYREAMYRLESEEGKKVKE
jgi:hypothetical protein